MATKTVSSKRLTSIEKRIAQLQASAKAIKESNARFKKMTPAQRRVEIAKDALVQLQAEKFIARTNSYISIPKSDLKSDDTGLFTKDEKEREMLDIIDSAPQCNVCARGALFLSACRRFNNFFVGDASEDGLDIDANGGFSLGVDSISSYESKFWSDKQISVIESFFEVKAMTKAKGELYWCGDKDLLAAVKYGEEFESDDERLQVLLRNIILNKGKFVVPKKYFE